MRTIRWFLLGALSVCALAALAGAVFVMSARGFSAREQPTGVERWLARLARNAALPADAKLRRNPIPDTPEVLAEARAHWADHCAGCHANDGSGDAQIGKRTYPPSPDMRLSETQKLTDGELFYIIQNGVRLTAMPAWASNSEHGEHDSWKLVRFIRHLPQLTIDEKKEMEKLNPKGPADLEEEEQEQRFLKGESDNDRPNEHQHHH
jgi:mono/diheme cytochrome c family protein